MELKTKIDLTLLKKSAIKEASKQNWERAKQINLAILNQLMVILDLSHLPYYLLLLGYWVQKFQRLQLLFN